MSGREVKPVPVPAGGTASTTTTTTTSTESSGATPAAGGTAAGAQTATGKIGEVRPDEVILQRSGASPLKLRVDSSTPVMIQGAKKTTSDLWAGTEVTATYHMSGDQAIADRIDVSGGTATP